MEDGDYEEDRQRRWTTSHALTADGSWMTQLGGMNALARVICDHGGRQYGHGMLERADRIALERRPAA